MAGRLDSSRPKALLLFAAAALMGFAALTSAFVGVPHLQKDLVEIQVRSTLLRAVSVALHFGAYAMFAFALLVLHAGMRAARGEETARLPLVIIAVLYAAFGSRGVPVHGIPARARLRGRRPARRHGGGAAIVRLEAVPR